MLKEMSLKNHRTLAVINNPDECPGCGMATRHLSYLDCMNHIDNCGGGSALAEPSVEIPNKKLQALIDTDNCSRSEPWPLFDFDFIF